ncbi:hypothetical protein P7K49_029999 [Saguinus oedipus]|uniref:Uncharacterized protein n=1 Tax=Saguinus oedipus TaxID=9490 RepID=A0ABQ9U8U7_SAGOE|nr:hypothetical protein P7K49_029999 [Saguinus oedipus]
MEGRSRLKTQQGPGRAMALPREEIECISPVTVAGKPTQQPEEGPGTELGFSHRQPRARLSQVDSPLQSPWAGPQHTTQSTRKTIRVTSWSLPAPSLCLTHPRTRPHSMCLNTLGHFMKRKEFTQHAGNKRNYPGKDRGPHRHPGLGAALSRASSPEFWAAAMEWPFPGAVGSRPSWGRPSGRREDGSSLAGVTSPTTAEGGRAPGHLGGGPSGRREDGSSLAGVTSPTTAEGVTLHTVITQVHRREAQEALPDVSDEDLQERPVSKGAAPRFRRTRAAVVLSQTELSHSHRGKLGVPARRLGEDRKTRGLTGMGRASPAWQGVLGNSKIDNRGSQSSWGKSYLGILRYLDDVIVFRSPLKKRQRLPCKVAEISFKWSQSWDLHHVGKAFPSMRAHKKVGLASSRGLMRQESYNPNNLIPRQLKRIPETTLCMGTPMRRSLDGRRPRGPPSPG